MSTSKLYYFVVARFVPDLLRNEPKNIGLILFDDSAGEYKVQFTTHFRSKLGSTLMRSDRIILDEYEKYFKSLNPTGKDQIINSIEHSTGKFQFSDIRQVVTEEFEKEFHYLYETFVEETPKDTIKQHRFKTTLKQEFLRRNVLGENKFIADHKIQVGSLEHKIDFSYQNGKLYSIEAIDLTATNSKANTYESAFKFDNLLRIIGPQKVKNISVIQKPDNYDAQTEDLLKVLNETSTVYNFATDQRQDFYNEIDRIVN
jgi:hypothetical protein